MSNFSRIRPSGQEPYLKGNTEIGTGCVLGPNTIIEASQIGKDCRIFASVMEFAMLEDHVEMGPFCHLRKGAHLASHVHMGNFGEVKDSYLGEGTKMGHFSYIGNAQIAGNVNMAPGRSPATLMGNSKYPTIIEEGVFIGSDTMLVAPVKIGRGAKTGAGAVVNRDVAPNEVWLECQPDRSKKQIHDHGNDFHPFSVVIILDFS